MELEEAQMDNIRAMVFDSAINTEDLITLLYDVAEEISGENGQLILDLAGIIEF